MEFDKLRDLLDSDGHPKSALVVNCTLEDYVFKVFLFCLMMPFPLSKGAEFPTVCGPVVREDCEHDQL